jgi:hypothetical protein
MIVGGLVEVLVRDALDVRSARHPVRYILALRFAYTKGGLATLKDLGAATLQVRVAREIEVPRAGDGGLRQAVAAMAGLGRAAGEGCRGANEGAGAVSAPLVGLI